MGQEKSAIVQFLSRAAIAGNILFVAWVLLNGIKEDFHGTTVEKISYISLMCLLAVNAFLLIRKKKM